MFANKLLTKQKKIYGVDSLQFKNCHEMPVFSKVVVRSISKEGSLTQRFLNFLQNSFLLEIVVKQFPFYYSPAKKGRKFVLPASKQVLKKMRLNKLLSVLFVLRTKIIEKVSLDEKSSFFRVSFKTPLNFPSISLLYLLFLKLGSVYFTSDFVVLNNRGFKFNLFCFFSKYFQRK